MKKLLNPQCPFCGSHNTSNASNTSFGVAGVFLLLGLIIFPLIFIFRPIAGILIVVGFYRKIKGTKICLTCKKVFENIN